MTEEKKTFGFCPMCMQNVEHVRKFSYLLFWGFDLLTLRILKLFRLGPWYCFQCERKTFYLRLVRRSAPTYHSDTSHVDFQRNSDFQEPNRSESVGNYLKNEHSLVMQGKRSSRFSQKYRDATVARILSGSISIAQIRQELDVQENDIINWIASVAIRKQGKIDELTDVLGSIEADLPEQVKSAIELANFSELIPENVVEGRVLPK